MFIGMFVEKFHVSAVIINLQLSNASSTLEVTFLKTLHLTRSRDERKT